MAEFWARALHPGIVAASAGTRPAAPHPRMLEVMREAGVDVEGARSKHLDTLRGRDWDLVVTLCDQAAEACPVLPGARRVLHRPFPDPGDAGGGPAEQLTAFRRVRDQIRDFVQGLPAGGQSA